MSELRSIVEHGLEQVPVRPLSLETMHRRGDRKRRNRRIRAGIAGVAIGLLLVAMGSGILRSSSTPANQPTPIPTQLPAHHTGGLTFATESGIVLRGDGETRRRQLVSGTVSSFDWSPDGSELAYLSTPSGGPDVCSLWVLDVATDQARRLSTCTIPPYPFGQLIDWKPDGTLITYQSGDQIREIAPDGTGDRFLVKGFAPTWSPDGRRLLYFDSDGLSIYAPASGITGVISGFIDGLRLASSPERSSIAVLVDRHGPTGPTGGDAGILEVWTMRPDGSHARELAVQHGCCGIGAIPTMGYSPDGSRILLTGVQLQVIDVATGHSRIGRRPPLMRNGVTPEWQPVP